MNKTEFWLMNNPIRSASLRLEAKKLRRMAPSKSLSKVLEIGCGQGQGTKNILRYFRPQAIEAIDLDSQMIARAQKRVNDSRVQFKVGDASDLSFAPDNSYDAIFDFGIIHHIPNWQACLQELYRVLKPGGYLHIEDGSIDSFTTTVFGRFLRHILDHPYDRMYTKAAFEKELQQLGFEEVKSAYWAPYLFWMVLQK